MLIQLAMVAVLQPQDTQWIDADHACTVAISASIDSHVTKLGTGFLWLDKMHVATAYHVVAGATDIRVYSQYPSDKRQNRVASVIATNLDADLAVLKMDGPELFDGYFTECKEPYARDEPMYVWGHPLGLEKSDRQVVSPRHGSGALPILADLATPQIKSSFLQIGFPDPKIRVINLDGNLTLGHSGGAVIKNHKVVGIVQGGVAGGNLGRSWAVPVDELLKVIPVKPKYEEGNVGKFRAVAGAFALAQDGDVDPTVPIGWSALSSEYDMGWCVRAVDNLTGVKFLLVRPGRFQMGSLDTERGEPDEGPVRDVMITRAFYLAEKETSCAEWSSMTKSPRPEANALWPQTGIGWKELRARLDSFNYRLPTEAEWEYACRAGTRSVFYLGDRIHGCQANFDTREVIQRGNGGVGIPGPKETDHWTAGGVSLWHPNIVGSYPKNPWGFYDMCGNVWELCEDQWDLYGYKSRVSIGAFGLVSVRLPDIVEDPIWEEWTGYVVRRGGSWCSPASDCRSANRGRMPIGQRDDHTGFRIACTPRRPEYNLNE